MGMYLGATVITGFELILFIRNMRRKKFCMSEHQLNDIHRRRQSAMSSIRSRKKNPLSQPDSTMLSIKNSSANFSSICKQEKTEEERDWTIGIQINSLQVIFDVITLSALFVNSFTIFFGVNAQQCNNVIMYMESDFGAETEFVNIFFEISM
jgi:hypothetical protein